MAAWDITDMKITGDHVISVKFLDGTEGEIKFLPTFFRGVFSHLQDQSQFQQVTVIDGVVTWPGGLDLAPDAMHNELIKNGQWLLT